MLLSFSRVDGKRQERQTDRLHAWKEGHYIRHRE